MIGMYVAVLHYARISLHIFMFLCWVLLSTCVNIFVNDINLQTRDIGKLFLCTKESQILKKKRKEK